MAIIRCPNGHFYDNEKTKRCPFCSWANTEDADNPIVRAGFGAARKESRKEDDSEQIYLSSQKILSRAEADRTEGILFSRNGKPYITGWIVGVKGPYKGTDHRLFAGYNRIGRMENMDISLPEDKKIAGKNHCSIVYENRRNEFFLIAEPDTLTYFRGEVLTAAARIQTGDRFSIGDSEFEFIAFCRDGRRWEEG